MSVEELEASPASVVALHVYKPSSPVVNCVRYRSPLIVSLIRDEVSPRRRPKSAPFRNHEITGDGADSGLHGILMFPDIEPITDMGSGVFKNVGANSKIRKDIYRKLNSKSNQISANATNPQ